MVDASLSLRILGFLYNKRVSSYREIKDYLHESGKNVSSTLLYMCQTRKLHRLPFSTKWGKIIYLPDVKVKDVFEYCFKNDLMPESTKILFHLLSEQRCVSTTELYDLGMDRADISFFVTTFTKQWRLIKITTVDSLNIFYTNEADIEDFLKMHQERIQRLQKKEWDRRQEEGKNLEEVIAQFYSKQGFHTRRNVWMTSASGEKIEIDVLAEKHFFAFESDRPIIIAAQCKNWRNGEHFFTLTEFLNHYCKLKEVLPSAIFHVWAYNYSKYFFTPSFCHRFPDVSIFYSKHIREAFKAVNMPENRPSA